MPSLPDLINQVLRAQRRPVVDVFPGMQVVTPTRRPGRPCTRDPQRPFAHYRSVRGKGRPRCLSRGCQKRLHVSQLGACSDRCADAVVNEALYMLRAVGVTPTELIELYRD